MAGPIALPEDGGERAPWWKRAQNWFQTKLEGERAPLLADENSPRSRRYNLKLVIASIVLSIVLIVFIVLGVVWYNTSDNPAAKPTPSPQNPPTDPEQFVISLPKAENTRKYLEYYTSHSHLAGTESDLQQAKWTLGKFKEFGISDSYIETYYPLLNYPVSHRLALISGPKELRFEAKLREDPVDEDKTSLNPEDVPTFHGYSKNGTVQGRVIYANYGTLEDFQYLVDQGVQVEGTIALVRYGGNFRGLKLMAAEKFGCIGALIFSDPIDDGPLDKEKFPHVSPAESYPEGPWRSPSSVQRGSVQYLSVLSGDPLTPGYAATKDAPRIKPEDSPGLTNIPSLPLSWEDALPLLKATQGHGVTRDEDWKGGLNEVDYFSGPTLGEVELTNHVDNKITPIWNVIGRINGTEEPDRAIILGNHRDAWVYGAVDPSSGSAVLLEIIRSLGKLLETGWKPRRTIIFASWDAEEYGLVGSTEWVEDHAEWLKESGATYINMDTAVSGPHFHAAATPSLNQLLYEVTQQIDDPRTSKSVYQAWAKLTRGDESSTPAVGTLGSGSDFVGFLDHIGIASVDIGFGGDYGVYHSNYDSFHWMEKFGDPTFEYHATAAKIVGALIVRLSNDRILPLHPKDYSEALVKYVQDIENYAGGKEFEELRDSVEKLSKTTRRFERRLGRLQDRLAEFAHNATDQDLPSVLANRVKDTNHRLTYFERGFIDPSGISSRPWFKHVVYAPSLWKGYASQTFPAIAEAVDEESPELLVYAVKHASTQIYAAAEKLKEDADDEDDN